MQQHAAAFFSPWDPPPSYTVTPQDNGLAQRITKLAEFAARNGPSFVDMMKERQKDNPEYAFLLGGEGADFYRWCLYCHLYNHPREQPLPGQESAAPPPQQQLAGSGSGVQQPLGSQPATSATGTEDTSAALSTLPQEVSSGFQQVLNLLSGSKDSIKASQGWFMACAPYAAGMAEMMLQHVLSCGDYQQQQHVLYLANDILFKALGQRAEGSTPSADSVAEAFRPRLGRMLARTYQTGGKTEEVQQSLARVVNFWAEKGVYDHETVERLTMEMLGISLTAAPQQAQQAQPAPPPAPLDPVAAAVAAAKAAAQAAAAAINRAAGMPSQPPAASQPPLSMPTPPPSSHIHPHQGQHPPPSFMATSQPQAGVPSGPPMGTQHAQQPPFPPPNQQQWSQYPPPQQQQYHGQYQQGGGGYPPPPGAQPYPPYNMGGAAPPPAAPHGTPGSFPPPRPPPAGGYYPPAPGGFPGHPGGYPPPPGGFPTPQQGQYPPPPAQPPSHAQQGQQQYPGPGGYYPPPGAPPGAYPPPGAQGGAPPPGGAPYYPPPPSTQPVEPLPREPSPEPEKEPFDPMSFPPGLIPRLVDDLSQTDPPYSPLSPLDIERTGVPKAPNMDAYLKSRIDKFYAQLQTYRPGMLFSDIEVDLPRRKHFADAAREAGDGGRGGPPAPLDDGSAPGLGSGGGGRAAGLGYTRGGGGGRREEGEGGGGGSKSGEQPADVFASYRNQRSRGYHDMIIRSAAGKYS